MTKSTMNWLYGITALILILGFFSVIIIQSHGYPSNVDDKVIRVYQVANRKTVYYTEQFNVSISIVNEDFWPVVNISLKVVIPSEAEYISSSRPDLDLEIEEDAEEFEYNFGTIDCDEKILFSVTYNVTSTKVKTITLEAVNVTFERLNGIQDFSLSESVDIGLRGKLETTTTTTLRPLPLGEEPAHPIFSVVGYIIPLIAFSISILVYRRLV
ncbi:MAG: hypothetical protein JSV04_03165 [Candidatus Heimdallarchaeota archaeon]|nr:MAG: hypothetical protein JSV04_03165 [Candidatus Heimdallarchaeota archaeon]